MSFWVLAMILASRLWRETGHEGYVSEFGRWQEVGTGRAD